MLLTPAPGAGFGQVMTRAERDREILPPLTPGYLSNPIPPLPLVSNSAKEYVESLHQNSKSQLIYGKNHVVVCQVLK